MLQNSIDSLPNGMIFYSMFCYNNKVCEQLKNLFCFFFKKGVKKRKNFSLSIEFLKVKNRFVYIE